MKELNQTKEPVRAMLQTLALQTRLSYGDRRMVSSMYDRYEMAGRLSPEQISLVTSLYLKYYDKQPTLAAQEQDVTNPAAPRKESRWSKLLKKG